MNDTAPPSAESDARLAAILDTYVTALRNGTAPARTELLQQYPDLAEDLEACLATVGFMQQAGWHTASEAKGMEELAADSPCRLPHVERTVATGESAGVLGDYRLLREVGRGGMGIVYEAEQMSLGRRVALKVLPFAAALDQRHLQRFRNEALAAAQLDHPHIVAVYGVGAERGVHYYAMQYIDGCTLADVISGLRERVAAKERQGDKETARDKVTCQEEDGNFTAFTLSPSHVVAVSAERGARQFYRMAARLGAEAAEALEQAHQAGVVHRDIKPANLLLDSRGRLFVSDFGLARFPGEAGLTRTGDLLGTLRYMSPEQALAQRGLIDQRTDVYALGATLYELVTLRPLFEGQDRQELLRQIAWDDPILPRRLRPSVPVELETIILKAVAKLPHERYTTSQELADDLRRFLNDEPIRARRPSLSERARKWSRRHQNMVASAVATLLIAVVVLGICVVLLQRQRNEVELRRQQARRAVDEMYTQFAQRWWSHQPHMELVQREFLLKALHFYSEFARYPATDAATRLEAAKAWRRIGEIQHRLGEVAAAEEALSQALGLQSEGHALSAVAGEEPLRESAAVRGLRAGRDALARECCAEAAYGENERGNLLRDQGRLQEAEQAYGRARSLFERLLLDDAGSASFQAGLAGCCNNLALVLQALERPKDAEPLLDQARDIGEALLQAQPDDVSVRYDLANVYNNRAVLYQTTGRLTRARDAFEHAVALRQPLLAAFPTLPAFQQAQAASFSGVGIVLAAAGEFTAAEKAQRQALTIRDNLAASFPRVPKYTQAAAASHSHLGLLFAQSRRPAEAEAELTKGLHLRQQLSREYADVPTYRRELADSYCHLGDLYRMRGQDQRAENAYREAGALRQQLCAEYPGISSYRRDREQIEATLASLKKVAAPATQPARQGNAP